MDIRLFWIWLSLALKAGNPAVAPLLRALEHPRAVFEADETALAAAGMKQDLIKRLKETTLADAEAVLAACEKNGIFVLTPDDALYPARLLNLPDLPPVLYGKGDFRGLPEDSLCVTVVGPRSITPVGAHKTAYLTAGLVAGGATIVSGGAIGGDAVAMQTALDCGGNVIAVQACGLDVNYPTETAALRERLLDCGGTLFSEYPPGTTVGKGTFFVRNRLMAGLSLGTLVTEAQARSGTLITAHCAREQGHDVFAVPGDEVWCAGCHNLIREGALLVTRSTDVLSEYLPTYAAAMDLAAAFTAEEEFRKKAVANEESDSSDRPRRRLFKKRAEKAKETEKAKPSAMAPKTPPAAPKETDVAVVETLPDGASAPAQTVFAALTAIPKNLDDIAEETALSPAVVLSALTELELFGAVQSFAGRQYARSAVRKGR